MVLFSVTHTFGTDVKIEIHPPPKKKQVKKLPIQNQPGFIGLSNQPKAMSWVSCFFFPHGIYKDAPFFFVWGGGRQFRVPPSDSIDGCWRCG